MENKKGFIKITKKLLSLIIAILLIIGSVLGTQVPVFAINERMNPENSDVSSEELSADSNKTTKEEESTAIPNKTTEEESSSPDSEKILEEKKNTTNTNSNEMTEEETSTDSNESGEEKQPIVITPYESDQSKAESGEYDMGLVLTQNPKVTPGLDISYTSGEKDDPWKGGDIHLEWSNSLKLELDWGLMLNPINIFNGKTFKYISQIFSNGFGFRADIILPEGITAQDTIEGTFANGRKPKLLIAGSPIEAERSSFSVDPNNEQILILTFKKENSGGLIEAVINAFFNIVISIIGGELAVGFQSDIDINAAVAKGLVSDYSTEKVLTKGKLPPANDKKLDFKVYFYDSKDINNNYDILPGHENKNLSESSLATWNSYISPIDRESTYNIQDDVKSNVTMDGFPEVKDESNSQLFGLKGSINNRRLDLEFEKDGAFSSMDSTRFNRVVNYFDRNDVTEESVLIHTPTKVPLLEGADSTIVYSGKQVDMYGETQLSPVPLIVNNGKYVPIKIAIDDKENYKEIDRNSELPIILSWLGEMNDKGTFKISMSIKDKKKKNSFWGGTEDRNVTVDVLKDNLPTLDNDPKKQTHIYQLKLPSVNDILKQAGEAAIDDSLNPDGVQVIFHISMIDEYGESSNILDYGLLAILSKKDTNVFVERKVTNERTNESNNNTNTIIKAKVGDKIKHEYTFKNTSEFNTFYNPIFKAYLPGTTSQVQYVEGSAKFSLPDGVIQEMNQVPLHSLTDIYMYANSYTHVFLPGETIKAVYEYTLTNSTSGESIELPAERLEASSEVGGFTNKTIGIMEPVTIKVETVPEELTFIHTPEDIDFGVNKIPKKDEQIERLDIMQNILISDTLIDSNWSLTLKQTEDFINKDGDSLPGTLIFNPKQKELGKEFDINRNEKTIYKNSKKNYGQVFDEDLEFDKEHGIKLKVYGGGKYSRNSSYTTTLTWTLTRGPQ
ncbi:WxL domain-containing protein [Enterococcus plantarum]|uniref:WxL domain-containing protein n=1 Tax=Enterococcus plantarum TaxID=1077675 RepID=UPI001A8DC400|nr:WxL domain-containing protein [Enterococcus plantarum]MBO0466498.1 WxL domain-containing protein [Enterococcus plantarum]